MIRPIIMYFLPILIVWSCFNNTDSTNSVQENLSSTISSSAEHQSSGYMSSSSIASGHDSTHQFLFSRNYLFNFEITFISDSIVKYRNLWIHCDTSGVLVVYDSSVGNIQYQIIDDSLLHWHFNTCQTFIFSGSSKEIRGSWNLIEIKPMQFDTEECDIENEDQPSDSPFRYQKSMDITDDYLIDNTVVHYNCYAEAFWSHLKEYDEYVQHSCTSISWLQEGIVHSAEINKGILTQTYSYKGNTCSKYKAENGEDTDLACSVRAQRYPDFRDCMHELLKKQCADFLGESHYCGYYCRRVDPKSDFCDKYESGAYQSIF